jgi:hypothetical protein
MKSLTIDAPTFGFVIGTRIALAFGAGLILSARLDEARRRKVGLGLVAIGVATTIPAALSVLRGFRRADRRRADAVPSPVERDERLIGAHRFPRKGDDDY